MPEKTNLNAAPYYDDFDANKNFYKVLFRPGYSIQSRELTTLQSILQNQIENYGKFSFKQGELVIPGEVGLNTKLDYVKLSSVSEVAVNEDGVLVYKKYDIADLVGTQLRGLTSGVLGNVVSTSYGTEVKSDTVFVNYVSSGDASDETTFRQGETLEVVDGVNTPLLVVGTDGSVLPTTVSTTDPDTGVITTLESPAMGYASAVKVEEGVYFVNGYFVRNDSSLLVIEEFIDTPSAKIGFTIKEEIVTPEQDASLYDNARGYSNYTAPGSHRLKISLELKKFEYDATTDRNFIQLLVVKNGVVQKQVKPASWNLLENTLARRTYDESGDYVVKEFPLDLREYVQKDGNFGLYRQASDGTVNGLTEGDASRKMVANLGPGKAYIRGYEIVNKETKYLTIDKARDTLTTDNVTIKAKGVSSFNITNVHGTIPLNAEGAELTAYPPMYLMGSFNDGTIGLSGTEEEKTDDGGTAITAYKETLNRRGLVFDSNTAIKTIYVFVTDTTLFNEDPVEGNQLNQITPNWFETNLTSIWTVNGRSSAGSGSTPTNPAAQFYTLGYSKAKLNGYKDEILELTVYGDKLQIELLLTEYDTGDSGYNRYIYTSESDALGGTAVSAIGKIIDYNEPICPMIGISKPKNFSIVKRGTGFKEDSDKVISRGRLADGRETYNTIFNLSYFNPTFFTKITTDSPITVGFTKGLYVFGQKSGAYGVVEGDADGKFSSGNILHVKTLSGKFSPGETITDELGNSLRIALNNTISHFVVSRRGTGYTTGTSVLSINGIEYDTRVVNLGINSGAIYNAVIENRDALLTEYAQPPSVIATKSTQTGENAIITAVLFRNTVLTYTPQNVKSLWSKYGSSNSNVFTADVEVSNGDYSSVSGITDSTFSGTIGNKFIECNGFNEDASKYVVPGDLVQYTDNSGNVYRNIVQFATQPEGILKSRIYLQSSIQGEIVNADIVKISASVSDASSTLVFPTGSKQVSAIVKPGDDSGIAYYTRRDFVLETTSTTSLTFKAQLSFGTQRFAAYSENNFVITVLDPKDAGPSGTGVLRTGDVIYVPEEYVNITSTTSSTSGLTSGSVTINLPDNYFGNLGSNFPVLKLTATLLVSKGKPRLKTAIKNRRIVVASAGDRVIPLRGKDYDTEEIEAKTYSDVYKLRYVYEGSASIPPTVDTEGNLVTGTDVTNRFTFDDGQRDTLYDVSRIVLKSGYDAPIGQLVIAFDYFDHSAGDFCTVDSYLHEAGVTADEIPDFNSSVNGIVSLKDVFDFRPKVDSNATISGYANQSLLSQADYSNFTGPGGVIAGTPAPDSGLEYTVTFSETQYLDRIDGIFLNKKGEFIVKSGNSSLNPTNPSPVDDAIPLYYLYIPSYTSSSKDVRVTTVDNRRYTMRDIGKLEKRIERLEYYTTMSVLEQQALNMQVTDDLGLDRFKSGFIVDNFETHKSGNLSSLDYQCAIDTQQAVLRPTAKEDSFRLREVNTRDDQRAVSGYVRNGDVITLPYSNIELLGNKSATKTINPNPFVVLQYVGDASLSPSIDQWYDTSTTPLVVDNNTGLYTIFTSKTSASESLSSIYNSFIINWVGFNKVFNNIGALTNSNTDQSKSTVEAALVASSSNISPQNNEIGKGISTTTVSDKTIANTLHFVARSVPVKFVIRRMKPNTKVYTFMEGINVGRWVVPDNRFTGIAGNSSTFFGGEIITDENGNASGIILIPGGNAPAGNTRWTGDARTVVYDLTTEEVSFTTGELTIRFTSSETNEDKSGVDSYTEVKYYASGILPENPAGIISTMPSYFKANEGIQQIDSNTDNVKRPNPLAQTFQIENYEGGVFATAVDVFVKEKSANVPLKVYLTNVDSEKPGKNIVPGSESIMSPNTYLKVYASGTIKIVLGELITGSTSGAKGPLTRVLDKNGIEINASTSTNEFQLTNEEVYTLILNNNNGISFQQNELLTIDSLDTANAENNTTLTLRIARDSGRISDLKVTDIGANYDTALITIESPQLPGGSTATGSAYVSGGKLYNAELSLTGSGYTDPPAVVIKGTGSGAAGASIQSSIEIDTPAVRMGVASDNTPVTFATAVGDDDVNDVTGDITSITPTRFYFEHPVYLQNDTEYALAIETDSPDYELWGSKLDEIEISTSTTVTTQPLLGSLYKSQNTESWTEDLFEDLKFTIHRAEFDTTRKGELSLTNEVLGYEKLEVDPIETDNTANTSATSPLFKANDAVVKIRHRDNGFEQGNSYVFFKFADSVGGLIDTDLNNNLFQVNNVGIDLYNITGITQASSSVIGGGSDILATYNRKFEKLYAQVNYLSFSTTTIDSYVKTTNIIPVDSNTKNYTSYSQTDYEKTFLNEEHFFTNQKVIASRINETRNNISRSLEYKFDLSSEVSYLSPVIDLRTSSVKTVSNRIENASGSEDRFGRRNQILTFLPIYKFTVSGNNNAEVIPASGTVIGGDSGANGKVVGVDGNEITVKLTNSSLFEAGEPVTFSDNTIGGLSVSTAGASEVIPQSSDFTTGTTITAFNEDVLNSSGTQSNKYDSVVSGTVVFWDPKARTLALSVDKAPISGDYISGITEGSFRSSTTTEQAPDIFRKGDLLHYPNIVAGTEKYIEVKTMSLGNGVDYVPEATSKNSSSVAKYVTKEVSIENPATTVNVKLTANVKDIENLKVYYRVKESSSQENFTDINWVPFNTDGNTDTAVFATPENSISGQFEEQSSYQELSYSVSDLPEFTSFAVKVVMKTDDPAYVPKVQDIRAVAAF